jgi:hypothetical protein
MSSKPNHRREHGRILERGPRYESANPAAGCNSTHVARGRKRFRVARRRAERREGVAVVADEIDNVRAAVAAGGEG